MSSPSDAFLLSSDEKGRSSFSSDNTTLEDIEADLQAFSSSPRKSRWTAHRTISLLMRVLIITLALWGILSLVIFITQSKVTWSWSSKSLKPDVYHPSTLPPDANACDCGTTLESALAKGCKYDSLAAAWLPASCRDDELTADFEKAGPEPDGSWPYWADKEGKVRITLEEVASLGPKGSLFWTTRDWHVAHCMFYWRKLYRMRDTNVIMERRYDGEKHVRHCGRLAMKDKPKDFLLVDVPVQMNSAMSLDPKKLPGMHGMLSEDEDGDAE